MSSQPSVRCQVFCLALFSLHVGAFGYGFDGVEGAWALASDPATPCVVLTNKTAWVHESDVWRPSARTSPEETGVRFAGIGAASDVKEVVFAPEGWKLKDLVKDGAEIQEGDVVWERRSTANGRTVSLGVRKLVRAPMPDWARICQAERYVGCWKPVRIDRCGGGGKPKAGDEVEGRMLLKVRPDRLAIFLDKTERTGRTAPQKPYRIERWLPLEGGLRFDYRERYARYDDPVNCMVYGMWLDPEDRLICYNSNEIMTLVRTDEIMDDPVDACSRMLEQKSFHGVWGVNSEFNIRVLSFDRSGKGLMTGFMFGLPFDWTVGADGLIRCVADEDVSLMAGAKQAMIFTCRYDPVKDTMTMIMPPDEDEGEDEPMETVLPFLSAEVQIDEMVKRLETARKSPEWKMRVERLRNRPPETPEARAARLARAQEKRAQRKADRERAAERKAREERERRWRSDVDRHYDQVVRNEVYYSETNTPPAIYLQKAVEYLQRAGTADDNHAVVERIRENPRLLRNYGAIAGHRKLTDEDFNWLFDTILADYLANRDPHLMRVMISSQCERISMAQYERAFGQLPDGDAVKSQIHADAHYRDRTFHPDWTPKRPVR